VFTAQGERDHYPHFRDWESKVLHLAAIFPVALEKKYSSTVLYRF